MVPAASARYVATLVVAAVVLAGCVGTQPTDAPQIPFEVREKTYDLSLERVWNAVAAQVASLDAEVRAGTQELLYLSATGPVPPEVARQIDAQTMDGARLHYRIDYELVVEGVTVRLAFFVEDAETGTRSLVDAAEPYERFFGGVDQRL